MSKVWTRPLAVFEIVGGIFGIAFVIWQLVAGQNSWLTLVFALIAFVVYALSFVAGIALLHNHRYGRIGSIIVQCIQLPKYSSELFVFMFSFGFDVYLYFGLINGTNVITGLNFKFLAFNQLFVNVANAPVIFGVSISSSLFLTMLLKNKTPVVSSDVAPTEVDRFGN